MLTKENSHSKTQFKCLNRKRLTHELCIDMLVVNMLAHTFQWENEGPSQTFGTCNRAWNWVTSHQFKRLAKDLEL